MKISHHAYPTLAFQTPSGKVEFRSDRATAMGLSALPDALAWLGALDAPISGALRASVDSSGALGPLNATLQIGEGVLQPTDATNPIAFTSARSYFAYDPVTQTMQIDELSVISNWVSASASGRATRSSPSSARAASARSTRRRT